MKRKKIQYYHYRHDEECGFWLANHAIALFILVYDFGAVKTLICRWYMARRANTNHRCGYRFIWRDFTGDCRRNTFGAVPDDGSLRSSRCYYVYVVDNSRGVKPRTLISFSRPRGCDLGLKTTCVLLTDSSIFYSLFIYLCYIYNIVCA